MGLPGKPDELELRQVGHNGIQQCAKLKGARVLDALTEGNRK